MITEFGQFGFEFEGKEVIVPVYNFTKGPSGSYFFQVKVRKNWRSIYYQYSPKESKWLWNGVKRYDTYKTFPYKVTKFYYNTTLELPE